MNNNLKYFGIILVAIAAVVGFQEYRLHILEKRVASFPSPVGQVVSQSSVDEYVSYYVENNKFVTGEVDSVSSGSLIVNATISDVEAYRKRNIPNSPLPTVSRKIKVTFDDKTPIDGPTGKTIVPHSVVQVGVVESFLGGDINTEPIPVTAKYIVVLNSPVKQTQ